MSDLTTHDAIRQLNVDKLINAYTAFIDEIRQLIGAPIQRQNALIRFDEGNFWLYQSILRAELVDEPVDLNAVTQSAEDNGGTTDGSDELKEAISVHEEQ